MRELSECPLSPRQQYAFYAALCLIAMAFTAVSGPDFRRFFGAIHPLIGVAAALVVGAVALWALLRFGFVIIMGRSTLQGIGLSAVFATALGVAIIIADLLLPYPRDINVPLPQSPKPVQQARRADNPPG